MEWVWRGETYAASRSEYLHIKNQLKSEMMPPEVPPSTLLSAPTNLSARLVACVSHAAPHLE